MFFRNEYWFLSNMYPCKIRVNGLEFECAEACFQSFKTTDLELRKKFQKMNGFEAKKFGKKVKLRPDWNDIRLEIMSRVIHAKFKQNDELGHKLAQISDEIEIVEDNKWHDTFWGRCNGIGENHLGRILEYEKHLQEIDKCYELEALPPGCEYPEEILRKHKEMKNIKEG